MGLFAWIMRAFVTVLLLSAGVQAAYKPVDISDIKGEQRKALNKLTAELKRMSPESRDCYICEQLGLTFGKDASRVLWTLDGHPATTNKGRAYFVGRGGSRYTGRMRRMQRIKGGASVTMRQSNSKPRHPLFPLRRRFRKWYATRQNTCLRTCPRNDVG